jgi:hypothetical protein
MLAGASRCATVHPLPYGRQAISVTDNTIIGAVSHRVQRYAGKGTFARIADVNEVSTYEIAIRGVPLGGGRSYRPGAKFGPGSPTDSPRTRFRRRTCSRFAPRIPRRVGCEARRAVPAWRRFERYAPNDLWQIGATHA